MFPTEVGGSDAVRKGDQYDVDYKRFSCTISRRPSRCPTTAARRAYSSSLRQAKGARGKEGAVC